MSAHTNQDPLSELPDQLLIHIIASIPYSGNDIAHCLRLSRRISTLISASQEWILSQVIQDQFPQYAKYRIQPTPKYMKFLVKNRDETTGRHDIHPVIVSLKLKPDGSANHPRSIRVLPVSQDGCSQALISHRFVSQWPTLDTLQYCTKVGESGRGGRFPRTNSGVLVQLSAKSRQSRCSALVLRTKPDREYQTRDFFDHCEIAAPFSRLQWWQIIISIARCTVAQQKYVIEDILEEWISSTHLGEVGPVRQDCWSFGLECYHERKAKIAVRPVLEGFCRQAFVSDEVVVRLGLPCHRLGSVVNLKARRGSAHQTQEAATLTVSLGQSNVFGELSANVVPALALDPFDLVAPLSLLGGLFSSFSAAESRPPVIVAGSAARDTDSDNANPCDPLSWLKTLPRDPAQFTLQEIELVDESDHPPAILDEESRKRAEASFVPPDTAPKSATRFKHARLF